MYPEIHLSPTLHIPTYYLVISLTVCLCLIWLSRRADQKKLDRRITLDLSLIIMVSGFIGGRLMHVLYEDFPYYREDALRILYFWNGGFVFYGGALLAGFASVLFLSFKAARKMNEYLDLFAPVMSLAYTLGRGACLLAGCCYGKYCDLPWAIEGRHPTQLYASLWELGVLFILLGLERAPRERPSRLQRAGSIFYIWMILHALGRLVMESLRDDFRGPSFGFSISSWISWSVLILGGYLLYRQPAHGSPTRLP